MTKEFEVRRPSGAPRMIGESAPFLEMQEHISKVAPLNKSVLVVGERGTGKELIAARLHYLSPRWDGAFLKLNCAAMSESLLEAQLLATRRAHLPAQASCVRGFLSGLMAALCFSMKLVNCRSPLRLDCYDLFKKARSAELALSPAKTSTSV